MIEIYNTWYQQFISAKHSLKQHKLRTFLSMLGVILGMIALIVMISVGEGAKQKTIAQLEQLGTKNIIVKSPNLTEEQEINAQEHLSQGLSALDISRIKKNSPFIDNIAPLKEITAALRGDDQDLFPDILAVSDEYKIVQNLVLKKGRFICDMDSKQSNLVCVLGYEIAKELGNSGQIKGEINLENEIFKVVGILENRESTSLKNSSIVVRNINRTIFIPLNTGNYIDFNLNPSNYSEFIVKVKSSNQIFVVAEIIKSIISHAHKGLKDYQIIIPQELINKQKQTFNTFNIFLGSIAAISLIIGGIGIMNIMLVVISERFHEIGIRRAIGASQDHIKYQFLAESIVISLIGGIIGLIIGLILIFIISLFGEWNPVINGWLILFSLCITLIIGILSGLYPAIKASKLDPIEALRYE